MGFTPAKANPYSPYTSLVRDLLQGDGFIATDSLHPKEYEFDMSNPGCKRFVFQVKRHLLTQDPKFGKKAERVIETYIRALVKFVQSEMGMPRGI